MKLPTLVLLFGALLCATASASDSYVVVRLLDPSVRQAIVRSGAIEVKHPDLRPDEVLVYATAAQLRILQNEANVAFLYPASYELIDGIPVHSCTPASSDLLGEYIWNVGRGWGAGGSLPLRITYSIEAFTSKMGRETTLETLQRALSEWSRHVQLDFSHASDTAAKQNLNVLFASGPHGDPFPFDGPRKTLAHTFYPADVNPEPIAGDLHFDEDENWSNGVDPDFYSVVLHEIGHALGLGHSNTPNAAMYPYYRRLEKLLPDDIAAVRRLYPARHEARSETTTATPTSPPPAPSAPRPTPESNRTDTAAPTLRIVMPAMTTWSTSAYSTRISGTATDLSGVTLVSWTASGGRSGVAHGTTTWTIPDFALRPGENIVIVRAYDPAGNMAWRSVSITRR